MGYYYCSMGKRRKETCIINVDLCIIWGSNSCEICGFKEEED